MKVTKEVLLLTAVLFVLALGLRIYKLTEIPPGLNQDETAIGYNAFSILTTGKDEYGMKFPLYFKSFGDYKLPVYIYLTALSIKIFGVTEFAVRIPSAFLGSVSVILLFFIVSNLTRERYLGFLCALLLAINPWHLHFSRAAFEVNVALFFTLLGIWAFMLFVHKNLSAIYLMIAIIGFGASLYSYNVTRLLSPLLGGLLVWFYFPKLKKLPLRIHITSILLFAIILTPFLLTFFTASGAQSAKGALLTSADVQAEFLEFRSYLLDWSPLFTKFLFNRYILSVWQYFKNFVSSFSTPFLFVYGSSHGNQGIGNNGVLYLAQFPLIIIGLIGILRKKWPHLLIFFWWYIATTMVVSLSKEVPHATRGYFLAVPLQVFSAVGIFSVVMLLRALKGKLKYVAFTAVMGFIVLDLIYYFTSYYKRFPILYAKEWRAKDKELVNFIKEHQNKYQRIIIDSDTGFRYSSLVFYLLYQPELFQYTAVRKDDVEGFNFVESLDKYEFRKVDIESDLRLKKTLVVTTREKLPSSINPIHSIYYPTRPIVLAIKEQIFNYPITESAFVLVQTNSEGKDLQ